MRDGSSFSWFVMESMMTLYLSSFAWEASKSILSSILLMPGSMLTIFLRAPIFLTAFICMYMSLRVNFPEVILRASSSMSSLSSISSLAISTNPARSPIPRRREMKRSASKDSRSLICSPTPRKTILASVVATADRAPPPFAVPSILVRITPVTPTALLNASA